MVLSYVLPFSPDPSVDPRFLEMEKAVAAAAAPDTAKNLDKWDVVAYGHHGPVERKFIVKHPLLETIIEETEKEDEKYSIGDNESSSDQTSQNEEVDVDPFYRHLDTEQKEKVVFKMAKTFKRNAKAKGGCKVITDASRSTSCLKTLAVAEEQDDFLTAHSDSSALGIECNSVLVSPNGDQVLDDNGSLTQHKSNGHKSWRKFFCF